MPPTVERERGGGGHFNELVQKAGAKRELHGCSGTRSRRVFEKIYGSATAGVARRGGVVRREVERRSIELHVSESEEAGGDQWSAGEANIGGGVEAGTCDESGEDAARARSRRRLGGVFLDNMILTRLDY